MPDFKLEPHATLPKPEGPVMVCILDGYGENEYTDEFNAVVQAKTPCFDKLRADAQRFRCATTTLLCELAASALRGRRSLLPAALSSLHA